MRGSSHRADGKQEYMVFVALREARSFAVIENPGNILVKGTMIKYAKGTNIQMVEGRILSEIDKLHP